MPEPIRTVACHARSAARRALRAAVLLLIAIFPLAMAEDAVAQINATWDGGAGLNGAWSNTSNWAVDTIPTGGSATSLTFGGTTGTTILNQDLGAPFILNRLTFTNLGGAASYTISGGALQFEGAAPTINLQNTGALAQTINAQIILGSSAGLLFSPQSSGNSFFVVNGDITGGISGNLTLTLGGGSNRTNVFNGLISDGSGTVAVVKINSTPLYYLTNNANSFTGNVTIQGGTMFVSSVADKGVASAIGAGTAISLGLGANNGNLSLSTSVAGTYSSNRDIYFSANSGGGGILTNDNANSTTILSFTGGTVSSVNSGYKALTLAGSNGGLNVLGHTVSNGSSTVGLIKNGSGLWLVAGSNTFNGGTTITEGALRVTDYAANLGSGNVAFMTVGGGVQAVLEASGTLTASLGSGNGQITWAGAGGGFAAGTADLTLRLNNNPTSLLTWNSGGFVPSTHEFHLGSKYSSATVTLENPVSLNDQVRGIRVFDGSADVDAVISGTLSSPTASAGSLNKTGPGTLRLTAGNSYTGYTTVVGGRLIIGNGGTSGSIAGPVWTLAGAQLAFNRSDAFTFAGAIGGTGGVGILSGTVSLNGANTYTGGTTVSAGATLSFNDAVSRSVPQVNVTNGGAINIHAATTTLTNVDLGNGSLNVLTADALVQSLTLGGGSVINLSSGRTLTITYNGYHASGSTKQIVYDGTGTSGAVITGAGNLSLLTFISNSTTTHSWFQINDNPNAEYDLTIEAPIIKSGASGMLKYGDGTLYLPNPSPGLTSTTMWMYRGTLEIGDDAALGSINTLLFSVNAAFSSTTIATLRTDGNAPVGGYAIPQNINVSNNGTYAVVISGSSDLTLSGSVVNSNNDHSLLLSMSPGKTLTLNRLQLSEGATTRTVTIGGTGSSVIKQIDGGSPTATVAGNLVVNGSGTLMLTGSNAFGGTTTVQNGTVLVGHANAFGSGTTAVTLNALTATNNAAVLTNAALNISRSFNVVAGPTGSTVALGGATAVTSTFSGNITFSQTLNLTATSGGTVVFSGPLTGMTSTAGLAKVDDGTVVISGSAGYTGATLVQAGSLNVAGTLGNTAVAITNGATLLGSGTIGGVVTSSGAIAPGGSGAGTLTLGGLILSGGSLNFDLGTIGLGNSDRLVLSGGAFNVTATTSFNFSNLGTFGLGTYDLISGYTGAIGGFSFLSAPALFSNYSLTLADNAGVLQLLVTASSGSGGSQDLTWSGGSGTWGSSNYQGSATYTNGDAVTFNDSAGTSTVAIVGSVAPGDVTVNNNLGNTYIFTGGPITGTATLNKLGAGALILADENSYTGPTTVAAGSLELRGAFASTNVTVSGGLIFNPSSGNQAINGIISGNGTLQKLGSGTTTLLGNNTFNGPTTVDAGSLIVGNAATLSGTVTVNNATFVANGDVRGLVDVQTGGVLHGNGSVGAIVLQNGGTLSVGNSVGSLTIAGDNAGGPSLTLNAGSIIEFEFRNASGSTPGTDWDYVDLGAGMLHLVGANNLNPANQIKVFIDSWDLLNNGHGANNFNAAPGTSGSIQEYYWKMIGLTGIDKIDVADANPGSLSNRFWVIDDTAGAGVFYEPGSPNGNPYARPSSSVGQGTFNVVAGNFNGQGFGLYIYYSAVPEPGSMLLAGLGSLAVGWYGRRRLRRNNDVGNAAPPTSTSL